MKKTIEGKERDIKAQFVIYAKQKGAGNIKYIASLSYGKDSVAMLEVIKKHNMPLDRIVHVEIMATKDIPADLPPMMEFKKKADKIIKDRYGIQVEHLQAPKSYEEYFYTIVRGKKSKKCR